MSKVYKFPKGEELPAKRPSEEERRDRTESSLTRLAAQAKEFRLERKSNRRTIAKNWTSIAKRVSAHPNIKKDTIYEVLVKEGSAGNKPSKRAQTYELPDGKDAEVIEKRLDGITKSLAKFVLLAEHAAELIGQQKHYFLQDLLRGLDDLSVSKATPDDVDVDHIAQLLDLLREMGESVSSATNLALYFDRLKKYRVSYDIRLDRFSRTRATGTDAGDLPPEGEVGSRVSDYVPPWPSALLFSELRYGPIKGKLYYLPSKSVEVPIKPFYTPAFTDIVYDPYDIDINEYETCDVEIKFDRETRLTIAPQAPTSRPGLVFEFRYLTRAFFADGRELKILNPFTFGPAEEVANIIAIDIDGAWRLAHLQFAIEDEDEEEPLRELRKFDFDGALEGSIDAYFDYVPLNYDWCDLVFSRDDLGSAGITEALSDQVYRGATLFPRLLLGAAVEANLIYETEPNKNIRSLLIADAEDKIRRFNEVHQEVVGELHALHEDARESWKIQTDSTERET